MRLLSRVLRLMNQNKIVAVECKAGSNRSAAVVIGSLQKRGCTAEAALTLVKNMKAMKYGDENWTTFEDNGSGMSERGENWWEMAASCWTRKK